MPEPVDALLGKTVERVQAARTHRLRAVLILAARFADLDVDELYERLTATDNMEELLTRTLLAAQEASALGNLVALARGLANGLDDEKNTALETGIARVLRDLDVAAGATLAAFDRTPVELGLAKGAEDEPAFQVKVEGINRAQFDIAFPLAEAVIDAHLATLVRLGLLTEWTPDSGGFNGGGRTSIASYRLTSFGRIVLHRLTAAAALLAEHICEDGRAASL